MQHTVNQAFNYYLETATLRKARRKEVARLKRRLEGADLGTLEIYKLTPDKMRTFIYSLKMSESSAYQSFASLRAILNFYVVSHSLPIKLNFSKVIPVPKKKSSDNDDFDTQYLTLAQVQSFISLKLTGKRSGRSKVTDTEARDIFLFMCYTGLSLGDLLVFDPNANVKEENNRYWLKYRRIKNGNLCRIPMDIPDMPALEVMKRIKWPIYLGARSVQEKFEDLGKKFERHLHPHMARHTFGSILLEVGFSMEAVSKMMGHSTIMTTEKVYAKVSRDKIEKELNEIKTKITTTNGQSI